MHRLGSLRLICHPGHRVSLSRLYVSLRSRSLACARMRTHNTIVYLLVFLFMNVSRQRTSPIHAGEVINYKNVDLLRRFITEQGKILPRRLTGVTAKEQRHLAKAVKQARILGFLQFLYKE
jgi:small subunit ribosomal protein S18